jgi:hypothetical protein
MKYLLFLIPVVLVNLAHAQKVTGNKQYQPEEILTVSFTPYFNEQGNPSEDFNSLFEEAVSSTFTVCCQSELEHNLMNHEAFNKLASRTIYSDLSELVRAKSNLFNALTDKEKLELQNGFKNTDLIVVTSKIDSRTVSKLNNSGNISVSGNITIFDLRTGEFVAFITDEIKKKFDDMSQASPPTEELVNSLITGLNKALEN